MDYLKEEVGHEHKGTFVVKSMKDEANETANAAHQSASGRGYLKSATTEDLSKKNKHLASHSQQ